MDTYLWYLSNFTGARRCLATLFLEIQLFPNSNALSYLFAVRSKRIGLLLSTHGLYPMLCCSSAFLVCMVLVLYSTVPRDDNLYYFVKYYLPYLVHFRYPLGPTIYGLYPSTIYIFSAFSLLDLDLCFL